MANNIDKQALRKLNKKIEKAKQLIREVSEDNQVTQREMWTKWSETSEKLMESLQSEVNRII